MVFGCPFPWKIQQKSSHIPYIASPGLLVYLHIIIYCHISVVYDVYTYIYIYTIYMYTHYTDIYNTYIYIYVYSIQYYIYIHICITYTIYNFILHIYIYRHIYRHNYIYIHDYVYIYIYVYTPYLQYIEFIYVYIYICGIYCKIARVSITRPSPALRCRRRARASMRSPMLGTTLPYASNVLVLGPVKGRLYGSYMVLYIMLPYI